MKRIIITLTLFLTLTTSAHAGEWFTWDETNTKLHIPLTLLMIADLGQTTWAQEHYWKQKGSHENNQFLGKYPSKNEVREYFALSYALSTFVTWVLPSDPKRLKDEMTKDEWSHLVQKGIIILEVHVVHHNYSLGIGVKF